MSDVATRTQADATDAEYTYYAYRMCVGAYFEMPTSDAQALPVSFVT